MVDDPHDDHRYVISSGIVVVVLLVMFLLWWTGPYVWPVSCVVARRSC